MQAPQYGTEVAGEKQQGDGGEGTKEAAIWCVVSLS
jgi:hypothetical protein